MMCDPKDLEKARDRLLYYEVDFEREGSRASDNSFTEGFRSALMALHPELFDRYGELIMTETEKARVLIGRE
jgi:hypothetical protein